MFVDRYFKKNMDNQASGSEKPIVSPISRRVSKLLESRPENDKVCI